jgi:hypothetical protein
VLAGGARAGGAASRWGAQAGPPACAVACAMLADARPSKARRSNGTPASMPRYDGHLALRAHETGDFPLDISERVRRGTKMRLAFQGWQARRGPMALTSRWWGASPHGRRGGRGSRSVAHGAAKPAKRPAHWRRSGARPSSISAGQRDFDSVFLQKVEVSDKNGRYESCR